MRNLLKNVFSKEKLTLFIRYKIHILLLVNIILYFILFKCEGVFKRFFRDLPEPLFPFQIYDQMAKMKSFFNSFSSYNKYIDFDKYPDDKKHEVVIDILTQLP